MNISHVILQKLQKFVNRFSSVDKPRRKWLCDMITGMIKSESVILSKIALELSDTTDKHHTEKRLDYNLRSENWQISDLEVSHLTSVSPRIKNNTPIAFDFGDVSKENVSHLEYPCQVYDGSQHEVSLGYWLIGATAILSKRRQQPMIFRAFSSEAPDYLSNNKERKSLIDTVFASTEGRGIAVIDRGGDDRKLYDNLMEKKRRFVIRQMVNRDIVYQGEKQSMQSLVETMPLMYCQKRPAKKGYWTLRYGFRKVYLPNSNGREHAPSAFLEPLYLVVAKAENRKEKMVLLTNIPVTKASSALLMVETYYLRWRIEDSFRIMKQIFKLESFAVKLYEGIKRLVSVVGLAYSFLTECGFAKGKVIKQMLNLGGSRFLRLKIIYYAIARAVKKLLYPLVPIREHISIV